jgi:hypothetical protein
MTSTLVCAQHQTDLVCVQRPSNCAPAAPAGRCEAGGGGGGAVCSCEAADDQIIYSVGT